MRYRSLKRNQEIGVEESLIQMSQALDIAASIAEEKKDVEGLLNTAAMWGRLSDSIIAYSKEVSEDEEEKVIAPIRAIETGFQRFVQSDAIAAEED